MLNADAWVEESAWRAMRFRGATQYMRRQDWSDIFLARALRNPPHVYVNGPTLNDAVCLSQLVLKVLFSAQATR